MPAAVVQHRSAQANLVASINLAYSSNVTVHNLLVCITGASLQFINQATDNNTNTITQAIGSSGIGQYTEVDYVADAHAGATTVTGSRSNASANLHLHIWEISGCVTSSPLRDSSGPNHVGTSGSVSTAGSSSLVNDAVVGSFCDEQSTGNYTAGTGFTVSEDTL